MNELKMYRLTGVSGLALVVFALGQFPLYMQGDPSVSVYDGAGLAAEALFGPNAPAAAILLTHIHLDHAGSALDLARAGAARCTRIQPNYP